MLHAMQCILQRNFDVRREGDIGGTLTPPTTCTRSSPEQHGAGSCSSATYTNAAYMKRTRQASIYPVVGLAVGQATWAENERSFPPPNSEII